MKLTSYHRIVIISVTSVMASFYSIFYLLVYIPEMVVWLGYGEQEKGYYTGILTGCFFLGAFITNYPFGVLADTYGHRNALMSLLVVNTALNILVSFSRDMYTLIVLRFMIGLCNAIFGLSRAIVSMYSDDSNHGIAMAINMAAARFSYFLLAMTGGFLVSLKGSRFLDVFPFFIPPFMGGVLGIISALTTYFMYPTDNAASDHNVHYHHAREPPNIHKYERLHEEPEINDTPRQDATILAAEGKTIPKSTFHTKRRHTKQHDKAENLALIPLHIPSHIHKEQSSSDSGGSNGCDQPTQNKPNQKGYSTFTSTTIRRKQFLKDEEIKIDKLPKTDHADEITTDNQSNKDYGDEIKTENMSKTYKPPNKDCADQTKTDNTSKTNQADKITTEKASNKHPGAQTRTDRTSIKMDKLSNKDYGDQTKTDKKSKTYHADEIKTSNKNYHDRTKTKFDHTDEIEMDKPPKKDYADDIKTDNEMNKSPIKSCWNAVKLHVSKFANFLQDITILRICLGGLFITAGSSGFSQLFSVWMSTIPDLGGLGYTHRDIGLVSVIVSLPAAVLSMFLIPAMERRFGAIYACTIGLVGLMICVSVVPLTRFVRSPQIVFAMMNVVYFIFLVLIALCNSFMLVILSNCVGKSQIGGIHGLGQMANTLGGTLSPIVGGMIFSASVVSDLGSPIDASLVFVLFGGMFWIASIIFVTLPSSLNYIPKDELGNRA